MAGLGAVGGTPMDSTQIEPQDPMTTPHRTPGLPVNSRGSRDAGRNSLPHCTKVGLENQIQISKRNTQALLCTSALPTVFPPPLPTGSLASSSPLLDDCLLPAEMKMVSIRNGRLNVSLALWA